MLQMLLDKLVEICNARNVILQGVMFSTTSWMGMMENSIIVSINWINYYINTKWFLLSRTIVDMENIVNVLIQMQGIQTALKKQDKSWQKRMQKVSASCQDQLTEVYTPMCNLISILLPIFFNVVCCKARSSRAQCSWRTTKWYEGYKIV